MEVAFGVPGLGVDGLVDWTFGVANLGVAALGVDFLGDPGLPFGVPSLGVEIFVGRGVTDFTFGVPNLGVLEGDFGTICTCPIMAGDDLLGA